MFIHCRKVFSIAAMLLALGVFALPPGDAAADFGDCAQPFTSGAGPVATDCLFILRAATGSETCDPACTCAPTGSLPIVATDALLCLIETVGVAPLACDCTDLQDPAFSFVPGDVVNTDIQGSFTAVDYIGAFPQDEQKSTGDWSDEWTISLHGNTTVWEPASGGTLGGAVPSANGACPAGTTLVSAQALPPAFAGTMDLCQLAARYDSDGASLTLTNDNIYILGGAANQGTTIGDGDAAGQSPVTAVTFTLNVEQGTLVLGSESEALAVTRGSVLNISGTEADPVVMGSRSWFNNWVAGSDGTAGRGEWGGLVVTGFGTANQCNNLVTCDALAEGFLTPFNWGGFDNTISSGTIEYLVVRNAGFDIDGNGNELNGITLFGIGHNTVVSHFQVHKNADDGIEFFGGDVVADHGVLTGNSDDNVDSDLGFVGGVQFAIVQQFDDEGDRGFETDSSPVPADLPVSAPTWANVTVVGNVGAGDTTGAITRSTTGGYFWNGIIEGSARSCLRVDDSTLSTRGGALGNPDDGTLQIHNYVVNCPTASKGEFEGESGVPGNEDADLETHFMADPNNLVADPALDAIGYPTANP